jgi:hypothetical protein
MVSADIPQKYQEKYLGIYVDRRLTWVKYIKSKRKEISLEANKMNWLIGRSTMSKERELLYKAVFKFK